MTIAIAALIGLLAGPLLRVWSRGLTSNQLADSEAEPSTRTVLVASALGAAFAGATAAVTIPWAAWTLWAVAGVTLAVIDVRTYLLPGKRVYPLGIAIGVALTVTAAMTSEWANLGRAAAAVAAVALGWLLLAFISPQVIGLGDIRLLAVGAGLLGWHSWSVVLSGQAFTVLLVVFWAAVQLIRTRAKRAHVPMGPAIVLGPVLATWLLPALTS